MQNTGRTKRLGLWLAGCVAVIIGVAGLPSCGSASSVAATVRNLTGTVSAGSLVAPSLSKSQAKVALDSCSGVSLCCWGYASGTPAVDALDSTCSFSLSLPVGGYCFCGFFNGSDADSDGCPDDYVTEDLPPIPVFLTTSGAGTDIALGDCTDGSCANDVNSLVDEDQDGTANSDDTDDDGDNTADSSDDCSASGCGNPLQRDGDADGIPDFYETTYDNLTDTDSDGIPNDFDDDIDGDGTDNADDTDDDGDSTADDTDTDDNGNGTADTIETDTDNDGVPNYSDGDIDGDGTANSADTDDDGDGDLDSADSDDDGNGVADYSETTDTDGDGIPNEYDDDLDGDGTANSSDDDDDGDGTADSTDSDDDGNGVNDTYETTDTDGDGISDSADTSAGSCTESISCESNFECQVFADLDTGDAFETDNSGCVSGCCAIVQSPEVCDNSLDDDADGFSDCLDTDCSEGSSCTAGGTAECSSVQDCSQLFTTHVPNFTYTEAAITCTAAGNCLYNCEDHATAFGGTIESCVSIFQSEGQTCEEDYDCDAFSF